MGQSVNFEFDGHRERSAFEVGDPKHCRGCVFLKTVDGVMGSQIDKCGEVVDGNVNNEVDGRRERGVIQKCVQNVGGKVNSGKMCPGLQEKCEGGEIWATSSATSSAINEAINPPTFIRSL